MVITDPPYGLGRADPTELLRKWVYGFETKQAGGFNGLAWDTVPTPAFWQGVLRVAKPGAHLLSFSSTRNRYLIEVGMVLAGWEIRDTIMAWVYGTGMGKQTTLDRALQKQGFSEAQCLEWEGWAQGLQPAVEPIIIARKPFNGSCLANVLEWGTGALNIDAVRISAEGNTGRKPMRKQPPKCITFFNDTMRNRNGRLDYHSNGRFPKNVVFAHHPLCERNGDCHSNCQVAALAKQSGVLHFRDDESKTSAMSKGISPYADRYFNTFYYQGHIRANERLAGCEHLLWVRDFDSAVHWRAVDAAEYAATPESQRVNGNIHPTVKPLELMRHLVKLTTKPGMTLLDPCCGSGSTLVAAKELGVHAIGVEREREYAEVARARLALTEEPDGQAQGLLPLPSEAATARCKQLTLTAFNTECGHQKA